MRLFLMLAVPAFLLSADMSAQGIRFRLLAGAGVNGLRSRGVATNYSAVLLPRLSAGIIMPLTKRVALVSGLDWQQKGYRRQFSFGDPLENSLSVHNGVVRYTQLSIPLQVAVRLMERKRIQLALAGGMSYGFMLKARTDWAIDVYYYDKYRYTQRTPQEHRISLLPYDNRVSTPNPMNYGALYLFNPAFAGSLTLQYRRHLLLQAYAEYNLYDAASTGPPVPQHLYSIGFCAGIRL